MVRQVVSLFDLSWTLLFGGGLLVPCSLPGPPVVKLLGEALKLPTLARHHGNYLHELFYPQEVLVRNRELISLHQPEEFGKSQKETPRV